MPELLQDAWQFKPTLVESQEGKWVARGLFGAADQPTGNKRIYPAPLYKREIGKLRESLKDNNGVMGELDHPGDGKTSLRRVSHRLIDLNIDENGQITGALEVLTTSSGRELAGILESGIKVGISSRGFGSLKKGKHSDGQEYDIVQDDYNLVTYDIVHEPACKHALPVFTRESVEPYVKSTVESSPVPPPVGTDGAGGPAASPRPAVSISENAQSLHSNSLLEEIEQDAVEMKAVIKEQAAKIKKFLFRSHIFEHLGRKAGATFIEEYEIMEFDNLDDLNEAMSEYDAPDWEEISKELKSQLDELQEGVDASQDDADATESCEMRFADLSKKYKEAKEQIEEMSEKIEEADEKIYNLELDLYIEKKIDGHANAKEMREQMFDCQDNKQIDAVYDRLKESVSPDYRRMKERLTRVNRAEEREAIDQRIVEEDSSAVCGVSINELAERARIHSNK